VRSRSRARCPSPVELERAFWSGDATIRSHAGDCARCGPAWQEIAALVEVGRAVPPPSPSPERREEIRTALLARNGPAPGARGAERPAWRTRLAIAPLAAAAAIALAWWARGQGAPASPVPPASIARAHLLAHDGARYMIAAAQPDEIVRLVDGTITVEVEPLQPGERFRVITGDGEVEVKGTAFDVTAAGDHLSSVRVMHGVVAVRPAGSAEQLLVTGRVWRAPPVAPMSPVDTAGPAAAAAAEATDDAAGAVGRRQPVPRRAPGGAPSGGARRGPRIKTTSDAGPLAPARTAAQQAFDEGWSAIRAADFDAAASAFERAASSEADALLAEDARYWRAVALARARRAARAAGAFEEFLDTYPSSPRAAEASVMLGWLLFERGDYAAAARRFRAAIVDPSERVRASAAKGLDALRRAGH